MSDPGISAPLASASATHDALVLPRRRELRNAPRRRRGDLTRPVTPVRPSVVATAAATAKRRGWMAAAAVLIVPGLVATAGLPAYASAFPQTGEGQALALPLGQQLTVSADIAGAVIDRGGVTATSEEEFAERYADPARAARMTAYNASGAKKLGDDYPWPYMAADYEGGGLSALGYYYRECVDFVAWRLNRDAGTTQAPYRWTWSNLTPTGGDARAWKRAWDAKGWPTGKEPVVGSVAWFAGNHVAYVKAITGDGKVVIEEYNHGYSHAYGIRTLDRSEIALFLYAPPA